MIIHHKKYVDTQRKVIYNFLRINDRNPKKLSITP